MKQPLSFFLRPVEIEDFIGQEKIKETVSKFIEAGELPSMILRGGPGIGKTSLANIIANKFGAETFFISGVMSKKEDLKKIIEKAQSNKRYGIFTIIFLDELHRWNKAQQDALLPYVEDGTVVLIGATTENPGFSVNNALISRCKVFVFEKLSSQQIEEFFFRNREKIYERYPAVSIPEESIQELSRVAKGELRRAINILETAIILKGEGEITSENIYAGLDSLQYYDKKDDYHYNIISAFIKSMRGSDVSASCYRLQRMIKAGEDPLFIARRMIIFASEDIGTVNSNALLLANNTYEAVEKVGMPEAEFSLFHCAIYLASSKKSNKVYLLMQETRNDVEKMGELEVPVHLRNAENAFEEKMNYGKGYKYPHNYKNSQVSQQYMPEELKDRKYID